MKNRYFNQFFLVIIVFILTNCSGETPPNNSIDLVYVEDYSIPLEDPVIPGNYQSMGLKRKKGNTFLYYFNIHENEARFKTINIESGQWDSFSFEQFETSPIKPGVKVFVHNLDSIFIPYFNSKFIILTNRHGESIDTINVDCDNCVPLSVHGSPMLLFKNDLTFCTPYTDIGVFSQAQVERYFERPSDLTINLKSLNQKKEGMFPNNYKKGEYFLNPYPLRTYNKNGNLVYAFTGVDSI